MRRRSLIGAIRPAKLPYVELDYIEATGTQWIDTGVKGDKQTVFTARMVNTSTSNARALMGFSGSAACYFGYTTAGLIEFSNYTTGLDKLNSRQWQSFELTFPGTTGVQSVLNVSGVSSAITLRASQAANTFKIFTIGGFNMSARIGRATIVQDGILVRDLIPCLRESDNEICMYDAVTNEFYTNAGTGSFVAGTQAVPSEYTVCEYLERTGTQYIDLGVKVDNTMSVIVDGAVLTPYNNTNYGVICGDMVSASASTNFTMNYRITDSTGTTRRDGATSTMGAVPLGQRALLTSSVGGTYIDGVLSATWSKTPTDFTTPETILLFSVRGSSAAAVAMRVYGFEIIGSTNMKLVPCLDANGTPCMYDKVSRQTLYNAGTGTFGYKI